MPTLRNSSIALVRLAWARIVVAAAVCLCVVSGLIAANHEVAPRSPLETVRAYADAANRGDLEAFLALYAPDIHKYRFPAVLTSQGLDHMREVYTKSFTAKKGIHVEIVQALVLGDMVVCHDHVTGLSDGKSADELTAYQVANGLITNIEYLGKIEN